MRDERGVALIIALVVVLILSGVVLAVAQITTADLEIHRVSRWDDTARYLAHAGMEHQIYLLKVSQTAGPVPYQNFPVLPSETAGSGAFWYTTTLLCITNCTGSNNQTRVWRVTSNGEVRRCCWTVLQQRQIRAQVQIDYNDNNGVMEPSAVTFLRWEEVYP